MTQIRSELRSKQNGSLMSASPSRSLQARPRLVRTSEEAHQSGEAAVPVSASPLQLRIRHNSAGRLCLAIAGELDLAVAPHLMDVAALVIATGATVMELNLAGVRFIDLRGSRALSSFQQRLEASGVEIVHGPCSNVVTRIRDLRAPPPAQLRTHRPVRPRP